jgi:anti-sigma B factor antagonist
MARYARLLVLERLVGISSRPAPFFEALIVIERGEERTVMASNQVLPNSDQPPGAVGELEVSVDVSAGRHLVRLSGELDLASSSTLVDVVDRLLIGADEIVVDIELVSFIDSSGLHALLSCLAKCEAAGTVFLLTPATSQVRRLFEIAGVRLPFLDVAPPSDRDSESGQAFARQSRPAPISSQVQGG